MLLIRKDHDNDRMNKGKFFKTHYARACTRPARNGIDDAVLIKRNLCMTQNNARTVGCHVNRTRNEATPPN